jgi:hypothetical protein
MPVLARTRKHRAPRKTQGSGLDTTRIRPQYFQRPAITFSVSSMKQVWGRFRTITCLEDRTTKKRGYAEPTRICT